MSAKVYAQPVAKSVPFDNSSVAYRATEVQTALEEVRRRIVWDFTAVATTNGGSKTLTEADDSLQVFTGTGTGYSVVLPDATTLFNGRKFEIVNQSNQQITVKTSGGATLFVLGQTSIGYITLQANSPAAGIWYYWQIFVSVAGGIVNYNLVSSTNFVTTSTTDVAITSFNVTPQAGTYAIWFNSEALLTTTPKTHWWSFYKGGVQIADSERSQDTAHSSQNMTDSTMTITQFTGSEVLDVRVRTQNGSLTIGSRTLILIRLGN